MGRDCTEQQAPLFDALHAAIKAGPLTEPSVRVRLYWSDKDAEYNSLEAAPERLEHSPMADIDAGLYVWAQRETSARLRLDVDRHLRAEGWGLPLRASGTNWPTTERAFEAAQKILSERATMPAPEPPAPNRSRPNVSRGARRSLRSSPRS